MAEQVGVNYLHVRFFCAQFTPPTRTSQDSLVLSCLCQWCEQNWRQVTTVFSSPHVISRLDKTASKFSVTESVLTCHQFCSHLRHGQDKTRQSFLRRRCKLGIRDSGRMYGIDFKPTVAMQHSVIVIKCRLSVIQVYCDKTAKANVMQFYWSSLLESRVLTGSTNSIT